ncbi:hypothetical protein BD779DRAFT_1210982 [Infundibulicybe gibba]|nr:hypothetical protein BD779DRAFT_1210982 [Infundibulicybe gibba]
MDVFGAVTTAIDLAGKLIGYLQAVKGAKEDRLKLLSEISALEALLQVLHLVKAGINRPLHACLEALKPIIRGLERLLPNANFGTSSTLSERMKDIKWPFHQTDIKVALGNIERLKTLASLALQTSLM